MTTVIIKTTTKYLAALILTFGAYIILHGHLTPGGGFQGGAVFASGLALLIVANKYDYIRRTFSRVPLGAFESIGALGFLGTAALGFMGYTFFKNVIANSGFPLFGQPTPLGINPGYLNTGGTLPYMNIFVGTKVLAGLTSIVLVFYLLLGVKKDE
ncbi:MnhB domain-containing protein [Thermococcus thioreducens]|uniref:Multicomponent Na+:H+ antiporter subunit B n=1 Tax=Thermococcus thioreducens TaxID=277988 RepID=A0A0Q2MQ50_9EURY|nr:MnhB domain-containing protein [Thermococcus thioreducens]ASJ13434.1 sodium:proton antiporter [Thermococcus thioreducens]KQH81791.1 sodium:proton antiporter [Thermococcus thioreducens]SEW24460.1 multicomponent Na+:H+ antiporter subunit B [Thermococcus thioreducens]